MESARVPVAGLVFDALVAGPSDGEPVLLLHGFPQTSRVWRDQLEVLAGAGYRAIAPDQRGYSPEARPTAVEDYAMDHLVGDVLGIADAFGIGAFHLVGHDWGGALAWQVSGRRPERVRTLTVLSTPHPAAMGASIAAGEQREKSSYMRFFRSPEAEDRFLDNDGALLRAMYERTGMPAEHAPEHLALFLDRDRLTGGLNWYRAADVGDLDAMGPVTMPTMYVWSTQDVALGREAAEWTGAHVEGPYRFEVLDGVSHWICEEAGDELNRLLLEHLAQQRTA